MNRVANSYCFAVGLELCTSTNPYVGESCGYGDIDRKKDAKCSKCRCKILNGGKACGIDAYDDICNPSKNH